MIKFLKKMFSKDYVKRKYFRKTSGNNPVLIGKHDCPMEQCDVCLPVCYRFIKVIPKKKIILCRKFEPTKLLGKKAVIKFDGIELKGVSE